jgi:N-acetylmuramoyl-L-alanine amidase
VARRCRIERPGFRSKLSRASTISGRQLAQAITGKILNIPGRNRRQWWRGVAVFGLLALSLPAHARVTHGDAWARERFATAERIREALNGRPSADRSRHDYQRAIDAYRRVYFGAPASTKADPSVVAAAELLVDMGRRFNDDQILHSAIDQYQFLRREYPGSRYRFEALFTIGEIYKDDLDDPTNARSSFEDFLHHYPHHHLADEAQSALNDLAQQAAQKELEARKQKESARKQKARTEKTARAGKSEASDATLASERKSDKPVRVTGIRHWSTPDYTRVAIDLEQDVKFESQRIANPGRIFFDLEDTKLASTLVGKTLDVDDGLLKKIRVSQYQRGKARVVLEVDDLSDYNAFLLSNPSRLIVDIHGKQGTSTASTSSVKSDHPAASPTGAEISMPNATAEPKVARSGSPAATTAKADDGADQDSDVTTIVKNPATSAKKADTRRLPDPAKGAPLITATSVPRKIVEADDDDDTAAAANEPSGASTSHDNAASAKNSDDHGDKGPALTAAANASLAPKFSPPAMTSPAAISPPPIADRSTTASRGKGGKTKSPVIETREARPTSSGDRSLIRALGLKIGRIVIDPGHGGHDTGTVGPNGLYEKDVVLDVAKRLGKSLETRLGAEVVYTRQDDTFIPLETRTAIANQEQADLFVSIHANSSSDASARGVETYYLNFTSSADALEVAARENAVSEKSIHELQDLVKKIALKEKIEESREFAGDVQTALHTGLASKSPAIRDRGVRKAPFIVLIGANMPSILAEISFVSNPTDEHKLENAEYRQRIAESLYRGIARYVNGLSGVKVASRMAKKEEQ